MRTSFLIFFTLQVADFVTTAIVLRLGGTEMNPIVRHFITSSSMQGLLMAKLFCLALGAACVFLNKVRAMRLSNIAFSGIVAWNVMILAKLW